MSYTEIKIKEVSVKVPEIMCGCYGQLCRCGYGQTGFTSTKKIVGPSNWSEQDFRNKLYRELVALGYEF